MQLTFTKGHGTENDFVLIPDPDGTLELSAAQVAALADRRAGLGADGVIRVVRTARVAEVADQAAAAEWFMDYRNADGSAVQMCGNGVRVFVTYLLREGWAVPDVDGLLRVATRGGTRTVQVRDGAVTLDLGRWELPGGTAALTEGGDAMVQVDGLSGAVSALRIDLSNPHTVVMLPALADLDALDLGRAPLIDPAPPQGSNVEFAVLIGPGHLRMRVHERGVGETRSCGTGAAAAALAARVWGAVTGSGEQDEWQIDVPGGTLGVRVLGSGTVELSGPAVLVADGTVTVQPVAPGSP